MTENFKDNLHQKECKQSKSAKFLPVVEGDLSVKNAPKLSAIYL